MAHKPNLKELDQQSTLARRVSAKLRYNRLTKFCSRMLQTPTGQTAIELNIYFTRTRNFLLLFSSSILLLGIYSNILVTNTRKETFKKNYAQIAKKYDKEHKEAFGQDTEINRLGYPDMGNNRFADLLPYRDWIKMNNV